MRRQILTVRPRVMIPLALSLWILIGWAAPFVIRAVIIAVSGGSTGGE